MLLSVPRSLGVTTESVLRSDPGRCRCHRRAALDNGWEAVSARANMWPASGMPTLLALRSRFLFACSQAHSAVSLARGSSLEEVLPYLGDYDFIAAGLLYERMQADTPLAPWLSSSALLAEGVADLPLLWPEPDRIELAGASTIGFDERVGNVAADFEWLEEQVRRTL